MLTKAQLDSLEQLERAATPGPHGEEHLLGGARTRGARGDAAGTAGWGWTVTCKSCGREEYERGCLMASLRCYGSDTAACQRIRAECGPVGPGRDKRRPPNQREDPRVGDVWEYQREGYLSRTLHVEDVRVVFAGDEYGRTYMDAATWARELAAGRLRLLTPAPETDGGGE